MNDFTKFVPDFENWHKNCLFKNKIKRNSVIKYSKNYKNLDVFKSHIYYFECSKQIDFYYLKDTKSILEIKIKEVIYELQF